MALRGRWPNSIKESIDNSCNSHRDREARLVWLLSPPVSTDLVSSLMDLMSEFGKSGPTKLRPAYQPQPPRHDCGWILRLLSLLSSLIEIVRVVQSCSWK